MWRRIVVWVLLVVVWVLTPLSVAGVWLRNQVFDDQTYTDTVAPLASDPAVQQSVANLITTQIFSNVDIESMARDALPPRAEFLAAPLTTQVQSFVSGKVLTAVQSEQFAAAWTVANRIAHHQVVNFLLDRPGAISTNGDTVVLDLRPVVQNAQQRLADSGFSAAANIPSDRINAQFVIADVHGLTDVQRQIQIFQGLTTILPFVTVGLLLIAVLLAPDRRFTLLIGTLGMAVGMILLALGLNLARGAYLEAMSRRPNLAPGAAAAMFDTVVAFLRDSIRVVFVVCVLISAAAFLAGPSSVAVAARARAGRLLAAARERTGERGWQSNGFGRWVAAHKQALRIGAVAAAGLLIVFLERPSAGTVLAVAAALLLVLIAIELFGAAGSPPGEPRSPAGAPPSR